jgi:hypothetical protein
MVLEGHPCFSHAPIHISRACQQQKVPFTALAPSILLIKFQLSLMRFEVFRGQKVSLFQTKTRLSEWAISPFKAHGWVLTAAQGSSLRHQQRLARHAVPLTKP